jgi:hypothetical protein
MHAWGVAGFVYIDQAENSLCSHIIILILLAIFLQDLKLQPSQISNIEFTVLEVHE